MTRYDINADNEPVPHFCRDADCFGTHPGHGYSWDEVCNILAEQAYQLAAYWRDRIGKEPG